MDEYFKIRSIAHQQIGGGYAMGPVVMVDTAEIEPGIYETMAMRPDGEELTFKRAFDEKEALEQFKEMLLEYAKPLQKAILSVGMEPGKKYTLLRMSEFGFPMAQKITFLSAECTTYAQHGDVIKLVCKIGRRRTPELLYLFYGSVAVYEGWQDLPDEVMWETTGSNDFVTMRRSRYALFDARYFEDAKKYLAGFLGEYKDFKVGADGRVYA